MRREYLYAVTFLMLAILLAFYALGGAPFLLLAWPATAFAIVAFAYLTKSSKPFCKRNDGTRPLMATLVLSPYLSFAYVTWSIQLWFTREPSYARVHETLFISRRLLTNELPGGVKRVCDLTSELSDPAAIRSLNGYVSYPILDASTCDPASLVSLARSLPPIYDRPLLIHCANGHGRTGMFAAIWLLTHGFASEPSSAIQLIQTVRPAAKLGPIQYATVEKAFAILTDDRS